MGAMGNGQLVMGQRLFCILGTFEHMLYCNLEEVLGGGKSTASSTKSSSLLVLPRRAPASEGGNNFGAEVVGWTALTYLDSCWVGNMSSVEAAAQSFEDLAWFGRKASCQR